MKNNGYSFTLLSESSMGFTKYRGIITCLNEKAGTMYVPAFV